MSELRQESLPELDSFETYGVIKIGKNRCLDYREENSVLLFLVVRGGLPERITLCFDEKIDIIELPFTEFVTQLCKKQGGYHIYVSAKLMLFFG